MTKLQEEIQAMGSSALVDYYNDLIAKHGGKVIKKFRNVDEGRDKTYHLAWTHGLDDEAPAAGSAEGEEEAKPNGSARKGRGRKAAAKAPAAAKGRGRGRKAPEGEEEEKPARKASRKPAGEAVEKGPLDTRQGTNKHTVVQLLLDAEGKSVPLKTLAKKVYKDEDLIGNVRMVLKGVAKSCETNPRYKLAVDKESATLTTARR